MKIAVYPGSFDPVTNGHLDIIKRSAKIFDKVIICILNNSSKKSPLFSIDERVNMLRGVVSELDNVIVDTSDGLLVDYAKEQGACVIIRGLRQIADFDVELQMAQGNRLANPDVETLFMATDPKFSFISSSMVREFMNYGRTVEGFVPDEILPILREKIGGH